MPEHGVTHEADGAPAERFDVVVIGAGVGGLAAGARLAHCGRRVLVLDRDDWIGGRAGTIEHEGFLLPQGGIALELGGPMERLFHEVGARYDVRAPRRGVVVRLGRRTIDTTNPIARLLVDGVGRRLGRRAMRRWVRPDGADGTLAELVRRTRAGGAVQRLARSIAAGAFGVNADEVSAHAVLTYVTEKGAFRRYGYGPRGTGSVLEELGRVIERHGGEVRLGVEAERILVRDGRAHAVAVRPAEGGPTLQVACDAVVSNAGPAATVTLVGEEHLTAAYLDTVRAGDVPTPMIVVDVASEHPLLEEAGIVFFGTTERVS
ncbi:MAG: FAD-dependent oxidoreductase, partial [Solirubrobacteraceae bacterium]